MQPPRLKNDCFALPPGVDWTPVDVALAHLRDNLVAVTQTETRPLEMARGCYLAEDARAARSHPPAANSAVDGYGFAFHSLSDGVQILPLRDGRAAAGAAYEGTVPAGQAIRILTGASLPDGVDTVVLEEDVTVEPGRVAFHGGLKRGANTRAAGEDVCAGEICVPKGRRLRGPELALLAATGCASVAVHAPLRVGVLSTGDEVVPTGSTPNPDRIYDANRPMLLAQLSDWGFEAVDLGHVADRREAVQARFDEGAGRVDAILTSGGASAGDEDHVSAVLTSAGAHALWRIAIKPGRPLALGLWDGTPVFALPGNPVAALVCTLVFAAPALSVLAGGAWGRPRGVMVPAAFAKNKRAGRREFLRARLKENGSAEVFPSEGSGRISGLSWAEGLVELGDGAQTVEMGTLVRYIPYEGFAP